MQGGSSKSYNESLNNLTGAGSSRQLNRFLTGGADCSYNEKTDRCSLRKDGKANDSQCVYNTDTHRCRINDSKRDKICLNVPYTQKDIAKSMGVRWDPSLKSWWTSSTNKNNATSFQHMGSETVMQPQRLPLNLPQGHQLK